MNPETAQLSPPPFSVVPLAPPPVPKSHRTRKTLSFGLFVVMAGGLGFLGYSFYAVSQNNTTYEHQLRADKVTIIKANGIIKVQANQVSTQANELKTGQNEIAAQARRAEGLSSELAMARSSLVQTEDDYANAEAQLSAQDQVPPGGYASFQSQLIETVNTQYSVDAATVNCILPSTWTPGGQFNCDVFAAAGTNLGTATITIDTTNPGEQASWEYTWAAAGSGY